jgi:hypothetical protein
VRYTVEGSTAAVGDPLPVSVGGRKAAGPAGPQSWDGSAAAGEKKGREDRCLCGLGRKSKRNRKKSSEFLEAEMDGFKWNSNLNEGFWTFSKIDIWTLVKDLGEINLNPRFGIFLK